MLKDAHCLVSEKGGKESKRHWMWCCGAVVLSLSYLCTSCSCERVGVTVHLVSNPADSCSKSLQVTTTNATNFKLAKLYNRLSRQRQR